MQYDIHPLTHCYIHTIIHAITYTIHTHNTHSQRLYHTTTSTPTSIPTTLHITTH